MAIFMRIIIRFVFTLHLILVAYSAPILGDIGNLTVDTITKGFKIEPNPVSSNKIVPAKEHLPHVNKRNLAKEYDRYEKQTNELPEVEPKVRETLVNGDQSISGLRSKLDEVKRQLVESQRVDRRLVKLDQLKNEKDFRLDGMEHLSESVQKLDKMWGKEKHNDGYREQLKEFDVERRRKYLHVEKRNRLSQKDKLRLMAETERLREEKRLLAEGEKKEYAKLNHPGSREHLESIWTESDGFDKGTFTPTAFFRLHDKNNDNFLDILELEAFIIPEIRKVYGSEDLNYEAREELALMREHLMPEIDLDRDELVSFDEFIAYTSSNERFNSNEGWQTLDQFDRYSQEDLKEFARERVDYGDESYEYYDYLEPLDESEYIDYSND